MPSLNDRSADGLSILLGDGTGNFEAVSGSFDKSNRRLFAVGHAPVSVAIGDLNGDSIGDVAVANFGSNDVSVILGGQNGFVAAPGSPFAVGRRPEGIAVGDLNGDGKGDVVTANSGDDDVTVLLSK